ncbi:MAG: phosphoribosylformylglycinamidine synthase subunit PurQ [Spirochaetales bacterium]|nr:phosphoribosylformylglycinamidine synthase subunit PurQ [Spirochaetales bacterium]
MEKPRVCIITGYGINADRELARAFELAGGLAERMHINDLIARPELLDRYKILGFPGGFSFGDHLGSGLVFSHKVKKNLRITLEKFTAMGKLVIGICNGFQVLVKMGLLPNLSGNMTQEVSLVHNTSGEFIDNWVHLEANPHGSCKWLTEIKEIDAPVRHGEGRFIAPPEILYRIENENLAVLRYKVNPNGSVNDIAGICDPAGQILGMMPHPEAFLIPENHPQWKRNIFPEALGLAIFKNGIKYVENL